MDFSRLELAVEIAEALNYDGRQPPYWHGHIGYAEAYDQGLLITRSYASPQEGCNLERLTISVDRGRVRLKGYDDFEQHIDIICPLSLEAVLGRVRAAVASGVRSAAGLVVAIRTGDTSNPSEWNDLVYEF